VSFTAALGEASGCLLQLQFEFTVYLLPTLSYDSPRSTIERGRNGASLPVRGWRGEAISWSSLPDPLRRLAVKSLSHT
jgi:hypothetical protein